MKLGDAVGIGDAAVPPLFRCLLAETRRGWRGWRDHMLRKSRAFYSARNHSATTRCNLAFSPRCRQTAFSPVLAPLLAPPSAAARYLPRAFRVRFLLCWYPSLSMPATSLPLLPSRVIARQLPRLATAVRFGRRWRARRHFARGS